MELVIHRDKLESSTERERERKRKRGKTRKEGVEQEGEECLEEGKKGKPREAKSRRKMWCGNVKSKKRSNESKVKRWETPQKKEKE